MFMMHHDWIDEYLLKKPGVTKDFKIEWQWLRYQVGGKLFAAIMQPGEEHASAYANKQLINLKCEPMLAELLCSQHAEILPAFYMDKRNWISVDLGGTLSEAFIQKLCDDSYQLVFQKLTKKLQKQILETHDNVSNT